MTHRMKTLVTGASGFIGSSVVRKLLARGREVRCYVEPGADRRNLAGLDVEILEGDVNDRPRIGEALKGCDVLYHLAAIYKLWMKNPALIYEVNVEGTKTVLWAAYKANLRKVVYTSSIAAIGLRADGQPSDETVPFNMWDESNAYIRSKWLSERDALRFAAEGLPLTVVNPSFPFGERDIGPTPTGKILVQALRGEVPGYMDGGFNCVDVDDVAEAHVRAEEKGRVGEKYLASGHNVTYRDFYTMIAEVAGLKLPKRKIPARAMWALGWIAEQVAERTGKEPRFTYKAARWASRNVFFDNSKAVRELGMPVTPVRETVEKSIRWFRANGYA
jgi:dihydroflavonol-4-reductase